MSAADDMKAAFDIHNEAYRQGFLAGARAMQEAAAAEADDWSSGRAAGRAIRALDPEKVGG